MNPLRLERRDIPLYFQIEQILKSKIITGEFMPGDQIPTEKDLSETYGISIITARQAILRLVNEGLLVRQQGKGSFVREDIADSNVVQLKGRINDLITNGLKTQEVNVLDMVKSKPEKRIAKILNLEPGEEVVKVRRVRSANNVPVSYIVNYLPIGIGEKILKKDLQRYPMLQILMDQFKIPLKSGTQYIEAIVADHEISSALSVSVFSPILCIETVILANRKKPVEFVRTYVRPDRYKYSVNLTLRKGPKNEVQVIRKE